MSGLFGSTSAPAESAESKKARERAEQRAEASEQREARAASARTRVRRTGGLRLLMSPERQEGPQAQTKLGGN